MKLLFLLLPLTSLSLLFPLMLQAQITTLPRGIVDVSKVPHDDSIPIKIKSWDSIGFKQPPPVRILIYTIDTCAARPTWHYDTVWKQGGNLYEDSLMTRRLSYCHQFMESGRAPVFIHDTVFVRTFVRTGANIPIPIGTFFKSMPNYQSFLIDSSNICPCAAPHMQSEALYFLSWVTDGKWRRVGFDWTNGKRRLTIQQLYQLYLKEMRD